MTSVLCVMWFAWWQWLLYCKKCKGNYSAEVMLSISYTVISHVKQD